MQTATGECHPCRMLPARLGIGSGASIVWYGTFADVPDVRHALSFQIRPTPVLCRLTPLPLLAWKRESVPEAGECGRVYACAIMCLLQRTARTLGCVPVPSGMGGGVLCRSSVAVSLRCCAV